MTKLKAGIITTIGGVLLFCVLYLSWSYNIRWYNTFQSIFAFYGYIQALIIFYKWLRDPSYEYDPKHMDTVVVASGDTIPNGWLNPFKIVKEKEKKNASDSVNARPASNGLSNAGHSSAGAKPVQSGTVDTVRPGNGESKAEHLFKDCLAAGEPESAAVS